MGGGGEKMMIMEWVPRSEMNEWMNEWNRAKLIIAGKNKFDIRKFMLKSIHELSKRLAEVGEIKSCASLRQKANTQTHELIKCLRICGAYNR